MAVAFYKTLYTKPPTPPATLSREFGFPELSAALLQSLDGPVTIEEVRVALFDMASLKAPGQDGLHAFFFQSQWHVVGEALFKEVERIFHGGHIPPAFNCTLLALIPKLEQPQSLKEFRPISLCTTIYKLVTKIISLRLKHIMPLLISPYQSSFIHGRNITDNIIIGQEAIHLMRRKTGKVGWMAVKVDLEKAFDKLGLGVYRGHASRCTPTTPHDSSYHALCYFFFNSGALEWCCFSPFSTTAGD